MRIGWQSQQLSWVSEWALVLLFCLLVSCGPSTFSSTEEFYLSEADARKYWDEMEGRVHAYLEAQNEPVPPLPKMEEVVPRLRYFWADVPTCDILGNRIRVSPKPGTLRGCMAHEYGHAALRHIHHHCWDNFEHRDSEGNYESCD